MLINALSFFISALAILLGPFSSPRNDNGQAGSVLSEMLDGFQFLRARKTVLGILALASVMNFFAVPLGVLMPVIAVEVLRVDSRGFGLLQGIVSVGMMLGGLALAMLGETRKKGWALIGGLILSGFLMSTLGWSRSFWPSLAILGFLGMVVAGVNITLAVIMQNVVPDDKRGRVFAAMATVTGGLQPIAMALAGVAADAFSASVVLIAAGVAVFASSFGAFLVPGLRELE
jgi:sugar phosphate permease